MIDFQELILRLNTYWRKQGCVLIQPLDMRVGAGTFHPATFLRSLGPEPWRTAYVQPSRRPTDGRYGENPNRLQHYYQYQVLLKPPPDDIVDLFFNSLYQLGLKPTSDDFRLVEDNWESPSLGAWGLGWEVWINGMEIAQFTYFQQVGGTDCNPVSGELTYGLERIAMYLQQKDDVYDLIWSTDDSPGGRQITYGDVYKQNEYEQSVYNYEKADTQFLYEQFEHCRKAAILLTESKLPLPAYEQALDCSHIFNLLDARRAISVSERQKYILTIRDLTNRVAKAYIHSRYEAGFPLLDKQTGKDALTAYAAAQTAGNLKARKSQKDKKK